MSAKTRFGSAAFSTTSDLAKKGLLDNGELHHGFTLEKRSQSIGFDADTGSWVLGAAGSGKFTTYLSYQLLAPETSIVLDCKGEAAATTMMLMTDYDCYCFNPFQLWVNKPWYLPATHRFNLLDCLAPESPTFFEDALNIAHNLISRPKGGGGNSEHFHGKAVQVATCCLLSLRENNPHGSLADLFNMLGDLRGGQEDYFLNLYYPRMKDSAFTVVRQLADEILVKRKQAPAELESIFSTIGNSIQCLGSPSLQMALSGPSTISIANICKPSTRHKKVFIILPAHMLSACASIVRCFFTAIAIEQQRNPTTSIHLQMDETGQLGQGFDLVKFLYSYGRGSKTKITTYWQNYGQLLDKLGRDGADTVLGNAQTKVTLAVSSLQTARFLSEYLGKSTYQYDPKAKQLEASYNRNQAFFKAIKSGDIASELMTIAKEDTAARLPDAVARSIYTPDELMNLPSEVGILDIKGIGIQPYLYQKIPYYLNHKIAWRFLPNPFHKPYEHVLLPTRRGKFKKAKVISETVPDAISQHPQYVRSQWSYIEGHCPIKQKRKWHWFKR